MAYLGELTNTPVGAVVTWNQIFGMSVTGHVPLRQVADPVTRELIVPATKTLSKTMQQLDINAPRVDVAALNLHAGVDGTFSDEEIRVIKPAMELAQRIQI